MGLELEEKIRTLAMAEPTLTAFFGTGPFRWFGERLPPGYLKQGATCLRMTRVSTVYIMTQFGLMALDAPYMQFDIIDYSATTARTAAQAVIAWLNTVSFSDDNDFASPPTQPPHSPNFPLNRRANMEAQLEPPGPGYVVTLDYRIWNKEN